MDHFKSGDGVFSPECIRKRSQHSLWCTGSSFVDDKLYLFIYLFLPFLDLYSLTALAISIHSVCCKCTLLKSLPVFVLPTHQTLVWVLI